MAQRFDFYKCNICGNVVQSMIAGDGELVCCGQAMELLYPQHETGTELGEKHTPVFETDVNGRFIRLKHHPMTEEHYIQLIQAISEDKTCVHTKFLRPIDVAEFDVTGLGQDLKALELCNIHKLWEDKSS